MPGKASRRAASLALASLALGLCLASVVAGEGDEADALREIRSALRARDAAEVAAGLSRLDVRSRTDPGAVDASARELRSLLRGAGREPAGRAAALLARGRETWKDWLDVLAGDGAPEVRLAALEGAALAPPDAERALVALARDAEAAPGPRALALEALGARGGPVAALLLARPLAEPEPWVLASGRALGLGRLGGREAEAALLALLASDDAAPRVHAWETLGRLTGARLPLDVKAWRTFLEAQAAGEAPPGPPAEAEAGGHRYVPPPPLHVPTYYGVPIGRARSHVVFCLDTSQSMYGRGMEQARAEFRRTLLDFPTTYAFDLIAFHRDVSPLYGRLVPAHPVVKAETLARVDALETISYTNLYDAVETALGYGGIGPRAHEPPARLDAVFLLSDGAPNRGRYWREKEVVRELAELDRGRVPVHCVAAGEEVFPLLEAIAAATGGRFVDGFR